MSKSQEKQVSSRWMGKKSGLLMETQSPDPDYEKKLRRRVEDRLRKDREALLLVARVLSIK